MHERRIKGNIGERLAIDYLKKKGYQIICAPWERRPYGEIDIVASSSGTLVFIEVKSRMTRTYGYPEEAVTIKKQRKLSRLIDLFRATHRELIRLPYRSDIIAIEYAHNEPRITHLEAVTLDG